MFRGKTINSAFRNTGTGARLDGGAGPSNNQPQDGSASLNAAQAAIDRFQKSNAPTEDPSKRAIRLRIQKEIEREKQEALEKEMAAMGVAKRQANSSDGVKEIEHSSAITKVQFKSIFEQDDFVGTKEAVFEHIKQYLLQEANNCDEDSYLSAILLMYTYNKLEVKNEAVRIITTYITNILKEPDNEKFKKINLTNTTVVAKLIPVIGAVPFLKAVGYTETEIDGKAYLVFSADSDTHLPEVIHELNNGEKVAVQVAREMKIFMIEEGKPLKSPKLSNDFFNLSAEELKKEQKLRETDVEKHFALRTKAMREKDAKIASYRYKYSLIRVRLPGNLIIQGIFGCHEKFSEVRKMVESALSQEAAECGLRFRDGTVNFIDDENATLAQYELAPAVVLHAVFNRAQDECVISETLVHTIQPLEDE